MNKNNYIMTPFEFTSLINAVLCAIFSDYYGSVLIDEDSNASKEKPLKFGIDDIPCPMALKIYFSKNTNRIYEGYDMYPFIKSMDEDGYTLNYDTESISDKYSFIRKILLSNKFVGKNIVDINGEELLEITISSHCIIRLILDSVKSNLSEYEYKDGLDNYFCFDHYCKHPDNAIKIVSPSRILIGHISLDCRFERSVYYAIDDILYRIKREKEQKREQERERYHNKILEERTRRLNEIKKLERKFNNEPHGKTEEEIEREDEIACEKYFKNNKRSINNDPDSDFYSEYIPSNIIYSSQVRDIGITGEVFHNIDNYLKDQM